MQVGVGRYTTRQMDQHAYSTTKPRKETTELEIVETPFKYLRYEPELQKWTTPLGHWLNTNHQTWKYLFSRSHDVIFAKHGGLYTVFSRIQQRRPSRSYSGKFGNPLIWYHQLPNDLVRADFHRRGSQQGHLLQVETTTNNNEVQQVHSTVN